MSKIVIGFEVLTADDENSINQKIKNFCFGKEIFNINMSAHSMFDLYSGYDVFRICNQWTKYIAVISYEEKAKRGTNDLTGGKVVCNGKEIEVV